MGEEGRGGRRAPLLVSCSRPGWLFSGVLSHDLVVDGGPRRALPLAASRSSAALGWFAVGRAPRSRRDAATRHGCTKST